MNQFKFWQIGLIYSVLIIGIIYALPNLYPTKPALQIAIGDTSNRSNNLIEELSSVLDENGIEYSEIQPNDNSIKIIFDEVEDQLSGRRILADYSDGDFIIALNSEPTTPEWLRSIGGKPVNLGLDLAGGIHFLLEVDTARYSEERLSSEGASLVEEFKNMNILSNASSSGNETILTFSRSGDLERAREYLNENNFITNGSKYIITQNGNELTLQYSDDYILEIVNYAVDQNLIALRNRVDELGVSEPIVQRQGRGRIVVELPGVQDSTSAKKII